MSIDNPNEYELAIETYAEAVRRVHNAKSALAKATEESTVAEHDRQDKWRLVRAYVTEGKIEPGFYRLHKGPGLWADGVMIDHNKDYPNVVPMFR